MIKLINRQDYTERITPFIDKNIIKVLTGQRRVGKSCILRQIQEHIEHTHSNSNTICINKELEEFAFIRTNEELTAYVTEHLMRCRTSMDLSIRCAAFKPRTLATFSLQVAMPQCCRASSQRIFPADTSNFIYTAFHIRSLWSLTV